MKNLIAVLALLLTPGVYAQNHRHHNPDAWIAPFIIGITVGAIVNRDREQPPVVYAPPVYIPQPPVVYIPPRSRSTFCLITVIDPITGITRNEPVPCIR